MEQKKGNQDNYLRFTELIPKVSTDSHIVNPTYLLNTLFYFLFYGRK